MLEGKLKYHETPRFPSKVHSPFPYPITLYLSREASLYHVKSLSLSHITLKSLNSENITPPYHIMPHAEAKPRTLYDKVFEDHIVDERDDGTILLYIDRHLVHEVTSPQAFEGLEKAGRKVRRPDCTLATTDHV